MNDTRTTETANSRRASVNGSTPAPLYVQARIFNEPGLYRVLEIGIEDGHKNNSYDVARLLRKLADWVEKEKA